MAPFNFVKYVDDNQRKSAEMKIREIMKDDPVSIVDFTIIFKLQILVGLTNLHLETFPVLYL